MVFFIPKGVFHFTSLGLNGILSASSDLLLSSHEATPNLDKPSYMPKSRALAG